MNMNEALDNYVANLLSESGPVKSPASMRDKIDLDCWYEANTTLDKEYIDSIWEGPGRYKYWLTNGQGPFTDLELESKEQLDNLLYGGNGSGRYNYKKIEKIKPESPREDSTKVIDETLDEDKLSDLVNTGLSWFGKGVNYQVIDDKIGKIRSFNTEDAAEQYATQYSMKNPDNTISIRKVGQANIKDTEAWNKSVDAQYKKQFPEPDKFDAWTGEESEEHKNWEKQKPYKLAHGTIQSTFKNGKKVTDNTTSTSSIIGRKFSNTIQQALTNNAQQNTDGVQKQFEVVTNTGKVLYRGMSERDAYITAHNVATTGKYNSIIVKYPGKIRKVLESLNERYSFPEIDDAIDHFKRELGRDPEVDDIISYIERIEPDAVPEFKDEKEYAKWYSNMAFEISARLDSAAFKNRDGDSHQ